jgi:membrane protease YdiL (CAAX protease family)
MTSDFQNTIKAVLMGMLIAFLGTIPRNLIFAANLRYHTNLPWAVPLLALYLWFFWRYLGGAGPPESTKELRRNSLRANFLPRRIWVLAIVAGALAIFTLILALYIVNRMVVLPRQELPDLSHLPKFTVLSLLIISAPAAAIIEESAFRGYMQGPIERQYGLLVAILITGTMFAIAHLDFTFILWPYYLAVAAIYGTITYLTNSILPAVVLHTAGNLYSNFDLWLHGQAEWQTSSGVTTLIWHSGADRKFWMALIALSLFFSITLWTYLSLQKACKTLLHNKK